MSATDIRQLPQPDAEVVCRPYGYLVYGWTHVIGRGLPMRLFISLHTFRWRAERARRRWLRQHGVTP